MTAKLIPMDGGIPFRMAERVTVVGRRERICNIYLDDLRVSRVHCVIRQTDEGEFELRDLGSTNGTRVNGNRVMECLLMDNDELSFAREKFRIALEAGEDHDRAVKSSDTSEQHESGGDSHESSGESDISGDDNRNRFTLTKSKQQQLNHVLLDDDEPPSEQESVTQIMSSAGSREQDGADDDPTQTAVPAKQSAKPSIHPCPHCTQAYMIASAFRWWEFPLKLLMLRPVRCPHCSERFIRMNV